MNEFLERRMNELRQAFVRDYSLRVLRREPTTAELSWNYKHSWESGFRSAVKELSPIENYTAQEAKPNPYSYRAKVTNVVDGDTFDATIDVGFKLTTTLRLRLLGVNTMETDSKIPEEKDMASRAKVYLTLRLLNKDVIINTEKSDVFGRYLAIVLFEGKNINQELLDKGLAVVFRG